MIHDNALSTLILLRATDIVETPRGELAWTSPGLHELIPVRCGIGLHPLGTWSAWAGDGGDGTFTYDTRQRAQRVEAIADAEVIAGMIRRGPTPRAVDGSAPVVR